jgi:hypothetical protein
MRVRSLLYWLSLEFQPGNHIKLSAGSHGFCDLEQNVGRRRYLTGVTGTIIASEFIFHPL